MLIDHLNANPLYSSAILTTILVQTTLILSTYADVPPPEGYKESCTVSIQSENGDECISCDADFETNDCQLSYGAQGYSKKCQSLGASTWTEVWCKTTPRSAAEINEPISKTSEQSKESCTQSPLSPLKMTLLAILLTLIIRPRLRAVKD